MTLYGALVLIHVISILVFVVAHTVSAMAMFQVRSEPDRAKLRRSSRRSASALMVARIAFSSRSSPGIVLGFMGGRWGRLWIWVSLVLLVVVGGAMTPLAAIPWAMSAGRPRDPGREGQGGRGAGRAPGRRGGRGGARRPPARAGRGDRASAAIVVITWLDEREALLEPAAAAAGRTGAGPRRTYTRPMRIAHVRERHAPAGHPLAAGGGARRPRGHEPEPRWLDLEVARRRRRGGQADPRPRPGRSSASRSRRSTTTWPAACASRPSASSSRGSAEWRRLRDSRPGRRCGPRRGRPRFGPPILRPPSFRDFYAFERHVADDVGAARRARSPRPWYRLPVFYFSNTSEIRGPGDPVWAPRGSVELDYELEVGALVDTPAVDLAGRAGRGGDRRLLVLNDWSARDLQRDEIGRPAGPGEGQGLRDVDRAVAGDARRAGRPRAAGRDGPDLAMTATVRTPTARRSRTSRGTWSSAHYSFGEMVARASADVHCGRASSSAAGRSAAAACSRSRTRRSAASWSRATR